MLGGSVRVPVHDTYAMHWKYFKEEKEERKARDKEIEMGEERKGKVNKGRE